MENRIEYEVGSGNIFKDLGFAKPDEEFAKSALAMQINRIIELQGLTQRQAGSILGINQPKVSAIKNGRLAGFSIERLLSFLRALDQDIDIVVRPKSAREAHITVAEGSVKYQA